MRGPTSLRITLREHGIGPENLVVYISIAPSRWRGIPGHPQGRRSLSSAGPEVPEASSPRFHARRRGSSSADYAAVKEGQPSGDDRPRVLLDEEEDAFSKFPRGNLSSVSDPGHLAYTIYTSSALRGTQRVMIPRSALVNFLYSMADTPGLTAADVCWPSPQFLSFDISIPRIASSVDGGSPGSHCHPGAGCRCPRTQTLARCPRSDGHAGDAHYVAYAHGKRLGR